MMNYEEFKKEVAENIKSYLPNRYEDAAVSLNETIKNNDTVLDGLTIKLDGGNVTPNIYLNDMYENYLDGRDMDDIMRQIAVIQIGNENMHLDFSLITDFDVVRDHVEARLVNKDTNQRMLSNMPHTTAGEFAVTYHVILERDESGTSSIPIANELMEQYGIKTSELHEIAMKNTFSSDNTKLIGMNQMLIELMGGRLPDDAAKRMDEKGEVSFILSNKQYFNGAIAMMDSGTLSELSEKFGGDFFILPSSTHEVIVMPAGKEHDISKLEDLVKEANIVAVSAAEKLSDHVYRYDSKERDVFRADKVGEKGLIQESQGDKGEKKPSIMNQIKKMQAEDKVKAEKKPEKDMSQKKSSKKDVSI